MIQNGVIQNTFYCPIYNRMACVDNIIMVSVSDSTIRGNPANAECHVRMTWNISNDVIDLLSSSQRYDYAVFDSPSQGRSKNQTSLEQFAMNNTLCNRAVPVGCCAEVVSFLESRARR